tara:strand:- start:546 stop:1055 length:510 start_codon:yes stop_codon:yes gene_type:complete
VQRAFTIYLRINDAIAVLALALGAAVVGFAVIALFSGAVERHVSGMGYTWLNDLPPMLMPWAVFPILGVLIRSDRHIMVEVLPTLLRGRARNLLRLTVYLICLVAALIFCWAGGEAVLFFRSLGEVTESEIEIPIWTMYLSFPVDFALLANFSLEAVLREVQHFLDGST